MRKFKSAPPEALVWCLRWWIDLVLHDNCLYLLSSEFKSLNNKNLNFQFKYLNNLQIIFLTNFDELFLRRNNFSIIFWIELFWVFNFSRYEQHFWNQSVQTIRWLQRGSTGLSSSTGIQTSQRNRIPHKTGTPFGNQAKHDGGCWTSTYAIYSLSNCFST